MQIIFFITFVSRMLLKSNYRARATRLHEGKTVIMNNVKLRIKIREVEEPKRKSDAKSFWDHILTKTKQKETRNGDELEQLFKLYFVSRLKESLVKKFWNEYVSILNDLQLTLEWEDTNRNDKYYFIVMQTKFGYIAENKRFKQAFTNNILARQIEFKISDLEYSSLTFNLSVEPISSAIELFENNYQVFEFFLNQYIPVCFYSALDLRNGSNFLEFNISFENRKEFADKFNNDGLIESNIKNENQQNKNNWSKYIWILSNTSLILPTILIIICFYYYFERIVEYRMESYREINGVRDNLLKEYQELNEFQKKTYQGLFKAMEKDTLK